MNRMQYLLIKLAEEASEVSQRALKTAQFGLKEVQPGQDLTNEQRLHSELHDLKAIIEMLNEEYDFNYSVDCIQTFNKKQKVDKFFKYSKELGLINEGLLCQKVL